MYTPTVLCVRTTTGKQGFFVYRIPSVSNFFYIMYVQFKTNLHVVDREVGRRGKEINGRFAI